MSVHGTSPTSRDVRCHGSFRDKPTLARVAEISRAKAAEKLGVDERTVARVIKIEKGTAGAPHPS